MHIAYLHAQLLEMTCLVRMMVPGQLGETLLFKEMMRPTFVSLQALALDASLIQ